MQKSITPGDKKATGKVNGNDARVTYFQLLSHRESARRHHRGKQLPADEETRTYSRGAAAKSFLLCRRAQARRYRFSCLKLLGPAGPAPRGRSAGQPSKGSIQKRQRSCASSETYRDFGNVPNFVPHL